MLGGRCLVNVEVKPPGRGNHDDVADLVLGSLESLRPRESVLISSFDAEMLAAVRNSGRTSRIARLRITSRLSVSGGLQFSLKPG